MDRFIVREARVGADYPQGNRTIAFSPNAGENNMIPPDNAYYGAHYASEFQNIQLNSTGFMGMPQMNTQSSFAPANLVHGPGQGQIVSGIDPRYLAGYSDNSAQFVVSGQRHLAQFNTIGNDYENRSFMGPDRYNTKTFTPYNIVELQRKEQVKQLSINEVANTKFTGQNQQGYQVETPKHGAYDGAYVKSVVLNQQGLQFQRNSNVQPPTKKITEMNTSKNEIQKQIVTRSDKLKALHKSGPRVFSGPVEKILKWHKALQDIGVLVLYEIVAKCVSVRRGESCAKNLVVRDENGPAMQVVYYEIDFMLPELRPPCTIRVIGRMMVGTSRLQAFNVRPATGDDVATLARRAAVSAHHVAKLCKEYGTDV